MPEVFDERRASLSRDAARIRTLLRDQKAFDAARRTTLNAHYTSADVVAAVWSLLGDLGLQGGRVLEPGCGSGNFIGLAPPTVDLVGVELDPTTASIARHLYGERAEIVTGRFEDFTPEDSSFDAAVGNVPFAKLTPHDPRHNPHGLSLHNYFIAKSLRLVRPGGTVAVITSRYTLDAANPTARRALHDLADLVGAIRLPTGAFEESAGTQVVCDLLVLRRRHPDADMVDDPGWLRSVSFDGGTKEIEPVRMNELFVARPDLVAGRVEQSHGLYQRHELIVSTTGALSDHLARAAKVIVAEARSQGQAHAPDRRSRPLDQRPARAAASGRAPSPGEGTFVWSHDGFGRITGGQVAPYTPRSARDREELRQLIGLREAARRVLAAQTGDVPERGLDDLAAAQGELGDAYRTYSRRFGPINRYRVAGTGRFDPETGEPLTRRLLPSMGGFRDDPDWPLVSALELFDDDSGTALPSPIFTKRVVDPRPTRLGVNTAAEALAVCLDERGAIDLDRIASLLGSTPEAARIALSDQVWDDPASGELVPASRYLSGNIRSKLDIARSASTSDARFDAHVAALERVLPEQLGPEEISARLGASWIGPDDIEAFCAEVVGARILVEHLPALGRWEIVAPAGRRGVALTSEWGTARADAATLLRASLNQQLHTVFDESDGGARIRNDAETLAARDKQAQLGDRFSRWVWEDPARASRLADRYNELFRSHVLPRHDGKHLTLPGLASTFEPRIHQRDAVARILEDGRTILAHAVGAGKTATMVMAAMELRRLGLAMKPAVVVPNHMLEQFTREWLQLYPTARLLIADRDRLSKDKRKEFVARATTGDWDGIVFTHAGFVRLPLGPETQSDYLAQRLRTLRAALAESRDGKGLSVKRLERRVAAEEERLRALRAEHRKDDGVRFEETGIDYLFVDEAHLYKNKRIDSSIDGMAHPGSQRAEDLDAKLWSLRRRSGSRVVTFATATPIANSMAELWVMQSFLQPEVIAEVGLGPFDAWAATFGRTVSALELAPDGVSWRIATRFARFDNVPELMGLWRQVADVRTAEELALPVPSLVGGKAETVVVAGSDGLASFMTELAGRAEEVRNRSVEPTEDNMLKITGDGRRAGLDLRLVGCPPDPDGGKVAVAADLITDIWRSTRARTYDGSDRPGALQLVFCDTSTPSDRAGPARWNAYDELRNQLVARGLPAEAVRFMHDAGTDDAKAKLFAAARDGRIAVLVGSTEKMGVGTNVQARAIALHHLDCPWRPADIEQRDGRILRQGNLNEEVRIVRYVTEGSFDTYLWQTLERKAGFIAQVTGGDVATRDVDDIGDQTLSFAEVKALAAGNPLIMEKAGVDAEVARLSRLHRAHQDDQHRLRRTRERAADEAASARGRLARLEAAISQRAETRGDRFRMDFGGRTVRKRVDAGEAIRRAGAALVSETSLGGTVAREIGQLGGLTITLAASRAVSVSFVVRIGPGTGVAEIRWDAADWSASDPSRIVTRIENRIHSLEDAREAAAAQLASSSTEAERAEARIGQPFAQASDLDRARRRQAEISDALNPPQPSLGVGVQPGPVASLGRRPTR